jgi:hypothetical protein
MTVKLTKDMVQPKSFPFWNYQTLKGSKGRQNRRMSSNNRTCEWNSSKDQNQPGMDEISAKTKDMPPRNTKIRGLKGEMSTNK